MSAESEARKAMGRLRRSVEKAARELDKVRGALRPAEGADFPSDDYDRAERALAVVSDLMDAEGRRLQDKILQSGGLEPGRVRRTGG